MPTPNEMTQKELFTWLSQEATSQEIEDFLDTELRQGADYLRHWLKVARMFAFATRDDSLGEFEKSFSTIVKRLILAERDQGVYADKAFSVGDHVLLNSGGPTMTVVANDGITCQWSTDGGQNVEHVFPRRSLTRVETDVEEEMEAAEEAGIDLFDIGED